MARKFEEDFRDKGKANAGQLNLSAKLQITGADIHVLDQVLNIAQQLHKYGVEIAIRTAASKMHDELFATTKKLESRKSLLALTASEAVAFEYWDACAKERLNFIRDFYPSLYAFGKRRESILAKHLAGMDRTAVLDFAKEYGQYLTEREAFVRRRPNYVALLKEIEKTRKTL